MATRTEEHNYQSSFKCRKCRHFLFSEDSVLHTESAVGNAETDLTHTCRCQRPGGEGTLWYISDDAIPSWIQTAIEEADWTRGKLACPKCRGRLGSFDFLTPSIRHHQDRQGAWSCVQIISSRVDRETPNSVLATLRGINQVQGLQVKDHGTTASSDDSLEEDSKTNRISSLSDGDGTLPNGCWYLGTHELDAKPSRRVNFDGDPICGKGGNAQTGSQCEVYDGESLKPSVNKQSEVFAPLGLPSTTTSSSGIGRSNIYVGFDEVAVDESVSFNLLSSRDTSSSSDSHARFRPDHKNSEHSKNRPCGTSQANPVDEKPQSGSSTSMHNKSVTKNGGIEYVHGPEDMFASDSERDTLHNNSISSQQLAETSGSSASSNISLQQNSIHSSSTNNQISYSESPSGQTQDAERQSMDNRNSHDESESEQANTSVVVGTYSPPRHGRIFLDELLTELERETSREQSLTSRDNNSMNYLEDELDVDCQQDASGNSDADNDTQDDETSDAQGMSASLQRAILRTQKKEKNRRKSERRKLQRREKWREGKKTEDADLLMEEQNLDCDSQKIMALLGIQQSGMSLREATTCPVCLDMYLNPYICLPCRHIFCEPCLRQLAQALQSSTTRCPLCRTVIQDVKAHDELTAAIQDMFPRIIALRKQNERKTLNKFYRLPGDTMLNTPMSLWLNHILRGRTRRHNAMGLNHSRWRGQQEIGMVWQIGAACVLMTTFVGLTGVFLYSMMMYS